MQESQDALSPTQINPTEARDDYNRLFYLSLDLLCVAGLDGFFRKTNPSWTRVLGWSETELLSRPVSDFMHPDDRERTLQARANLAKGVPIRGLENRYLCKDGSYRWLSWQSSVELRDATVFAVARDITERLKSEHEQLVLSKLESTGILAGGIAHDFNNLLGSLMLNLDLVGLCGDTTDEQRQHLRQAQETVRAAKSLTQQLITFSEGGASQRCLVDLKDLLLQSAVLALSGSTVRVECVLAPNLWTAEVDEAQIDQCIRNLVLNAREASPAAGVVRLEAKNVVLDAVTGSELPPGDYLCISVTDEGSGIAPEVLPKIFDPYFSTKQRGTQKGMGLGLTICRAIINKHGGMIVVDSRPGHGTTATCHLPAVRRSLSPAPTVVVAASAEAKSILVMDDEPCFLEIVTQTLRHLGYRVESAKDGDEAITLYEQAKKGGSPFAAVLLDLTVRGGKGGRETMKVLRARDPAVKAVLMTGYGNDQTFRDYASHGFSGALSKPFSAVALHSTLAEILEMKPARSEFGVRKRNP